MRATMGSMPAAVIVCEVIVMDVRIDQLPVG